MNGQRPFTTVNGPKDSKVVASNLVKGQPPCEHLPQDDAPAEDITLLRVRVALKDLGGHPGRASLVVRHDCLHVTGRAEITNL